VDFSITKNPTASVGSEPAILRSWVPEASTQTPRPPKPLIRTHDRSRRATLDLRLRPRGHWDRNNTRMKRYIKWYTDIWQKVFYTNELQRQFLVHTH
jgi:hypothetical protein